MKIDTAEKANELFEYRDGSLYWKIRPSPAANIGDKAGCVGNRGLVRIHKTPFYWMPLPEIPK